MHFTRKPKLVIALLTGATLVLLGGGAVAATLPGPNHMMQMMALAQARQSLSAQAPARATTAPSTAAPSSAATVATSIVNPPPASAAPTSAALSKTAPTPVTSKTRAPITYVVMPGDTLSGIAAWFQLHGYGDLYAVNAAMIGADPNLIKPGERITIGDGGASMASPA